METKHTKGEWSIGKGGCVISTEKTSRNNYDVQVYEREKEYYGGYLIAESMATKEDAKLIAAAPDLLEALLKMDTQFGYYDLELTSEEGLKAIKIMKKAIQKATN